MPAGSSGSSDDDGKYQVRYGEMDGESSRFLGLKLLAPNDVRTNGAERRLVLESLGERVE